MLLTTEWKMLAEIFYIIFNEFMNPKMLKVIKLSIRLVIW